MTTEFIPEHERTTGARPTGTHDEAAAATSVREMFDTIAPTYDRANHLLSGGIDRYWWTRAARVFRRTLARPEARVLDLCCGTGDMALHLLKHRPKVPSAAPILAVDFSHQMLHRGAQKFAPHPILPIEADALHLPIASGSLDLVTSAFGFRNLANYEEGLAELFRVLAPGGQVGILDCNQPAGLVGALYSLYFKRILPRLGGLVSGTPAAYSYLPASVERFPRPPRMLQLIHQAGFVDATWTSYTLGTAGLYRATKPEFLAPHLNQAEDRPMHKALLLALLTATSAAQSVPAVFNTIRASESYRNAINKTAQGYEQALSTHCATVELQIPAMSAKILGPFQLDAKGNLVTATWKETVPGTACGDTRVYNIYNLIRSGKAQVLPLLPGHSFAGPQLQHDAMTEAAAAAVIAGAGKDCAFDAIDTALPNGEPASAHINWDERWTLRACGKRYLVTLHFVPDAGGTTIHAGGRDTVVLP